MQITIKEAGKFATKLLKANEIPYIQSSPGIGKSSLYHQIAEQFNLYPIDWRASAADPTDLNGYPDLKGEVATYKPFDTFPVESTPIPDGYRGWLLICDEVNSALPSVQAPMYKLFLDRMVGLKKLHSKVFICAAGNLDTDNAITKPISTALISRCAKLEVRVDYPIWQEWAIVNGISPSIIAFLNWSQKSFYTFDPKQPKESYACPRTWEKLNNVERANGMCTVEDYPMVMGIIGKAAATEYLAYIKLHKDIITIDQILAQPMAAPVPDRQDLLYVMAGKIAESYSLENADDLNIYVGRMPREHRLLIVRMAYKINKALLDNDGFADLVDEYIEFLN